MNTKQNQGNFFLTDEQAKDICACFGKDFEKVEHWEICELLDKVIDKFVCDNLPN